MKKTLLTAALAGFAALQTASAISYTFDTNAAVINAAASAPDTFTFSDWAFSIPDEGPRSNIAISSGGLLSYTKDTRVLNDNSGVGAPPYGDFGNYLSVGASGSATINYAQDKTALSFLWGSIDTYNSVDLFLDGVSVFSLTNVGGYGGYQGPGGTAQFTVTDVIFDTVVFKSTGNYAFEIDNISTGSFANSRVPDGGLTIALLGFTFIGLAGGSYLVRRFKP